VSAYEATSEIFKDTKKISKTPYIWAMRLPWD